MTDGALQGRWELGSVKRLPVHFGASAGRAYARRRDAGDAGAHRRGAATKPIRRPSPPRPSVAAARRPLALLLAPHIPHRVLLVARASPAGLGASSKVKSLHRP